MTTVRNVTSSPPYCLLRPHADESPRTIFRGFAGGSKDGTPRTPANVKLRHQAISFVSAGTSTPIEAESRPAEKEVIAALAEDGEDSDMDDEEFDEDTKFFQAESDIEDIDDSGLQTNIVMDTDVELSEGANAMANMNIQSSAEMSVLDTAETSSDVDAAQPAEAGSPEALPFFVDTAGDQKLNGNSKASGKQPMRRAPSPAPSDSSGEEIVFNGRNRPTIITDPVHRAPQQQSTQQTPHVTDDLLAALDQPSTSSPAYRSVSVACDGISSPARGWAARKPKNEQPPNSYTYNSSQATMADWTPAPPGKWWKKGIQRPDLDMSEAEKRELDERASSKKPKVGFAAPSKSHPTSSVHLQLTGSMYEIPSQATESDRYRGDAEATIASLQSEARSSVREHKKRSKAAAHSDGMSLNATIESALSANTTRRGKRGRRKQNRVLRMIDNLEDDEDVDGEAAYEDYMENLKRQLDDGTLEMPVSGSAAADGGPSLVVDGEAIDEHDVLDNEKRYHVVDESATDSTGPIGQDIDELSSDDGLNASDLESSDLEDELEYDEQEQWEDEEDLRQRRIDAMTDEQIARLYAKQAELGIEGDELVIDDGAYVSMDDLDGLGDLDEARAGLAALANGGFGRTPNKHGMRRRGGRKGDMSFPDASALADTVEQYGEHGFEIMDFERPSLRPTKKGRKGKLPPELEALSDDELREDMRDRWDNDRAKKRAKKVEREELRAQGLLGSAGRDGKADLSQKYLEGMTVAQIHEELRIFLQDDGKKSRPFPPMDKTDRRALHEIANALNLSSKSVGGGKNRFPVLYKTSYTLEYDESTFDRITYASSRGFLKNSARTKGKKAAKLSRFAANGNGNKFRASRAGAAMGAVSLRNGEIVGAGAAAIGKENFGHKLMSKMGWMEGTALGRAGEGLIVPVEQVMRTGKAGLG